MIKCPSYMKHARGRRRGEPCGKRSPPGTYVGFAQSITDTYDDAGDDAMEVVGIQADFLRPPLEMGDIVDNKSRLIYVREDGEPVVCLLSDTFNCKESARRVFVFANDAEHLTVLVDVDLVN
jgi:hypothetical protein